MGAGKKDNKKAPAQEEEIQMEPVYVGKGPPPTDPKNAKEPEGTSTGIDFSDLDEAYDNVTLNVHGIENRRGLAVREVLGNLNEADSPSVADQILKTLAVAALGAASGGITTAIAAKLAQRNDLNSAIQTAFDDAAKDAVPKIFDRLAATGSPSSKASFFATQEEAIYAGHEEVGARVNKKKSSAHKRVHETTGDGHATKADLQAKALSEAATRATAACRRGAALRQLPVPDHQEHPARRPRPDAARDDYSHHARGAAVRALRERAAPPQQGQGP